MRKLVLNLTVLLIVGSSCFSQTKSDKDVINNYFEEGNFLKAIEKCEKSLKSDSLNDELYYLVATAYQSAFKYKKASDALKKALTIKPTNIKYKLKLANLYYEIGANDKAIRIYQDLFNEDYSNYQAGINLANIYFQTFKYGDALTVYQSLLKIDSLNFILLNKAATCFFYLGKTRKAIDTYKISLRANSQNIPTYKSLSSIYFKRNRDSAIFYLTKAIDIDSTDIDLFRRRGDVYYELSYSVAANRNYFKALSMGDSSNNIYKKIGRGYLLLEKYSDALKYLTIALKKDSLNDWESSLFIARAYKGIKSYNESLRYFDWSIYIQSKDLYFFSETNREIAKLYEDKKDYVNAIEKYKKAMFFDPDEKRRNYYTYQLAKICDEKLNDYKSAAFYYKSFLDFCDAQKYPIGGNTRNSIKDRLIWLNKMSTYKAN